MTRPGVLRLTAVAGILAILGVMLTGPLGAPPAIASEPGTVPFVQVRIDSVTPDVITTTSDPVVTVTGSVTNVGDRPVHDVMVRLEHAAAVASSAGLRTNLDGANDQYRAVDTFVTISDELRRGQVVRFTLSAPLRSANRPSLEITQPGVYPALVNVNGTPDYGDQARLDDARFLLPVVGVPLDPDAGPATDPLTGVVAPNTTKPVRITMLWPLADKPRLYPGAPGGTLPVRLADDDLAGALASGGRLDVLLASVEFATSPAVDPDGAVGRAVCLAVDPDLLVTVNAMTAGYVVPDTSDGAETRPGAGQAAASAWLDRLRALAQRICITSIPYAQADLAALQRVANEGLSSIAVNDSADVVDELLGIGSARGVTLFADGAFSRSAADLLSRIDTVAIIAGDCSAQDSSTGAQATTDVTPRRVSTGLVTAPFDPAVGAALAAVGADPIAPTYLDSSLAVRLQHDSAVARRQDALGSMLWRGLEPGAPSRAELLLPPTFWSPQSADAQALLTTLATMIHSGLATPQPLTAVIAAAQDAHGVAQLPDAAAGERGRFDDAVVTDIASKARRLDSLTSALTTDTRSGLTGVGYTAPLREDMLRALSQAQPPDTRNGLARRRLGTIGATIDDLFAAVTIVKPTDAFTLTTEHGALPVVLHNNLAVPIRVRLRVDAPPGMTVTDVGEIELPPGYLPQPVPTEAPVNQRFAVDMTLQTPDGVPLGEPVRLSVHANAYGKVLFAITLSAAAVLLLLTGRRLWHRFRGQPDRADLEGPPPGHHRVDLEKHPR